MNGILTENFPYVWGEDREKIENKYHKKDEYFDAFNRNSYHGYDYDKETGLSDEEINEGLAKLVEKLEGNPKCIVKARLEEYLLDSTMIDVNENDFFPGLYSWGRFLGKHCISKWWQEVRTRSEKEYGRNIAVEYSVAGCAYMTLDFDHSVPDWDSLARLGIPGIIKRLDESAEKHKKEGTLTEKMENFYTASKILYEAVLRLIKRLYAYSEKKDFKKAEIIKTGLLNLSEGAPKTTYDMLLLIYLYFMVSECFDSYQVRSLGYGLDATLYPFYKNDLEKGAFTKEEITAFISHFLLQFSAMGNYWGQPMYLGGTNADGTTKVNELSRLIIDAYDALGLYNPKIQIKISEKTPKDFVYKLLEMIRHGNTSIVFVNEEVATKAMMRAGATYEEALDFVIKGCYEYAVKREVMGISFNFFNLLKPVELVLNEGVDPVSGIRIADGAKLCDIKSFKAFYTSYLGIFERILTCTTEYVDVMEKYIDDVNPTMLYSGTLPSCVEKLTDASDSGIRNVTDMLVNGLGSAVNALMAVDHLVFEEKAVTLSELKKALDANWDGYEDLRQKAISCPHKYGNGDEKADFYANAIHDFVADFFAGRKNSHGGNYEYEIHSARTFLDFGKSTGATPDGRFKGEETSKNASPAPGTDTKGITALINSVTKMDLSRADSGACLDAMMHPSSVQGEEGMKALYSVLMTYIKRGGASIHFNIFSAEMLKDAQKHPERYKNLQVRVCGWNILWNDMAKEEQEMYIKRAENIAY